MTSYRHQSVDFEWSPRRHCGAIYYVIGLQAFPVHMHTHRVTDSSTCRTYTNETSVHRNDIAGGARGGRNMSQGNKTRGVQV